MKRRAFIDHTAKAAALSALAPSLLSIELKSNYKLGYQLYSIRDEMAKAPIETLKVLKSMGYQDFEAYGNNEKNSSFYGFKSSEFMNILDDLDVSVTSGHYGFASFLDKSEDYLRQFVDKCIVGAKAIDSKYITWPWIAPEQRNMESFKRMIPMLNKIGEQVTNAGLGFAYHNHGFEFEDHGGQTGYELILRETDPSLVKLQMDMYWVMHSSNFTPADLIKSQPGRFVMWHIKDMDKVTRDYTELGNGSIDYTKLLPDPDESGLQFYYLEQGGNFAYDSTRSARESARYFKKHLEHKI